MTLYELSLWMEDGTLHISMDDLFLVHHELESIEVCKRCEQPTTTMPIVFSVKE